MSGGVFFGVVLAAAILGLGACVMFARSLFAAIAGFVASGLLLSLAWMLLAAPDVALTEAALGGGVMGALLFGAYRKLRHSDAGPGPGILGRVVVAVLCLGVTVVLMAVVLTLPAPIPTLAPEARAALPGTDLGNAVTATLMAFRALDTMLEKVVLLLALVAVWSLAPDRFWGGRPVYEWSRKGSAPLLFLARRIIPVSLLVGIFLFWVGADKPGGAFAGGAVISAMLLLVFLARLRPVPRVQGFLLRVAVALGIAVFLGVGLTGLALGAEFLAYPNGWTKPVIVGIEVAMTLSVGITLALLVAGPPARLSVRKEERP